VLRKNPFIKPMVPTLARTPPAGDDWIHEVKFDGWRAQVHVEDGEATLFSKNGADLTRRFRAIKSVIDLIPVDSAILDCELVACDEAGLPCFRTLMDYGKNNAPLCLWAFDLLYLNGVRITPLPLTDRKKALADVVMATDSEHLQFSGAFTDPITLLETCDGMNLEGIVSKRVDSAYRSGPTKDWLKIKTVTWRAANRDRWEMFEKR
jgi:bifunctional non-homologous end joining protein LigD